MEKGSVYKAKYRMKWAGLILLMPWGLYILLDHLIKDPASFWFVFIVIGFFWTIALYTFVVQKIWKKVIDRYVNIRLKKVVNYHKLCITAILNEDYQMVDFIIKKCLTYYDTSSNMTYLIRGAYLVGTKDIKTLTDMENELSKIKL